MKLFHIVAAAKNGAIGLAGALPWQIKEDLRHFKHTTMGHIMIMGRKTYDSLGRVLPGRFSIVVSRQKDRTPVEGVTFCDSLERALETARRKAPQWGDQVFIIGGGEIYRQTQAIVDGVYLTRVEAEFEGDTFYPAPAGEFKLESEDRHMDRDPPFSFLFYTRR